MGYWEGVLDYQLFVGFFTLTKTLLFLDDHSYSSYTEQELKYTRDLDKECPNESTDCGKQNVDVSDWLWWFLLAVF